MIFLRPFLLGLCMASGVCATSQAAMADGVDPVRSQVIEVNGSIRQHCAISSPNGIDLGELDHAGLSVDFEFGLDCNAPFMMKVEAARGALTNIAYPQGQGPYSGSLPYVLDLAIPVRNPGSALITRSFNGRDLIGGQTLSSNGAIATQGMEGHLTLGRPDGAAGLLAGNYAETITVTISLL